MNTPVSQCDGFPMGTLVLFCCRGSAGAASRLSTLGAKRHSMFTAEQASELSRLRKMLERMDDQNNFEGAMEPF